MTTGGMFGSSVLGLIPWIKKDNVSEVVQDGILTNPLQSQT